MRSVCDQAFIEYARAQRNPGEWDGAYKEAITETRPMRRRFRPSYYIYIYLLYIYYNIYSQNYGHLTYRGCFYTHYIAHVYVLWFVSFAVVLFKSVFYG